MHLTDPYRATVSWLNDWSSGNDFQEIYPQPNDMGTCFLTRIKASLLQFISNGCSKKFGWKFCDCSSLIG